jgi:glycosyltransferase involved in cell wall biosynthesis
MKISFLISVHNEEKILYKCLNDLVKFPLPKDQWEVIFGLDGCDDQSESIIRLFANQFSNLRYYSFKERRGKNEVINDIIKLSSGNIIVIMDCDWKFKYDSKEQLLNFFSIFNNPEVGGIAESFAITYPLKENYGVLESGVTVQAQLWIDFIKEKGIKLDKFIILNGKEHPLLVNIFRKDIYQNNNTLADDFERCLQCSQKNKLVLASKEDTWPRMISAGETYSFGSLLKQKKRTALARDQLKEKLNGRKLGGWPLYKYIIDHLKDYDIFPKARRGFNIVSMIFLLGSFLSLFQKNRSTKNGWMLRSR